MYKSKIKTSTESRASLERKLKIFLNKNSKIYLKCLKRNVSLDKLPSVILKRKTSATARLQKFWVAIDIMKHEKKYKVRLCKGCLEYEIMGFDCFGEKVYIHLREELSLNKDKILFFISCY